MANVGLILRWINPTDIDEFSYMKVQNVVTRSRAEYLAWKEEKRNNPKTGPYFGNQIKFASAHDLRRSLAERLREEGVSPLVITRVLRHSSWEVTSRFYAPGEVHREAQELRERLGK